MSLFPAYAVQPEKPVEESKSDDAWLTNSSFKVNVDVLHKTEDPKVNTTEEAPSSCTLQLPKKRKKKDKKKKSEKHRKLHEIVITESDGFKIDKTRTKEFLTVKTISRPAVPRYQVTFYLTHTRNKPKRRFKRYYQHLPEKLHEEKVSDEEKITRKNLSEIGFKEKEEHFTGFKQEEELSGKTAKYNKAVNDDPNDIKMWLEYIAFQDCVYDFEKTYRKGSMAKAQRVLAERKLAILDKALNFNPNCEALFRERLNIAVGAFPSDELQVQLKALVEKDQGNLILWQGYIETTQCSMSHCNTPAVLNLYNKCLSTLHKLRRNATLEKPVLEESILRMLYQCGLFLKQAGLFEQLWTLLQMYLELNLAPTGDKHTFHLTSNFQEQNLVELEEVVFKSQLPLHELWMRTEKLREACHWLPFEGEETCEDPQRVVFAEDVAELIHPITLPENTFKFTATVLTLLKIPLLPCRHSTMQELGLDYVPWALDSIEPLLAVFFPVFYTISTTTTSMLNETRLAVGPQYLKNLPGQEEYLEFVLNIMKSCLDCMSQGDDKLATTIWWFRFQRLLVILEKGNRIKMTQTLKKKQKNVIKNFLKLEENRNNALFYCEYALIEYERGNVDSCINILKTAIAFNTSSVIKGTNWSFTQSVQCYLHRILLEVSVAQLDKNCLNHLVNYILQKEATISPENLAAAQTKLQVITNELLLNNKDVKIESVEHFLPDFLTDWLLLHSWFLYLTEGPIRCGTFLETTLNEMENYSVWRKEILYEFYVMILLKYCLENPGGGVFKILDDVLYRAIEIYPNNLFLLTVLAKEQSLFSSMGQQWWSLKNMLLKTGRAYSTLFVAIIAEQKVAMLEDKLMDTVTGEKYAINSSLKNQMLALYRRITKSDMCTRRCGLVWRLYLQFVDKYFSPKLCREVYYLAVEECPWVKALYMDAAIYIPAELPQIQDLIIEKQLRLHVTPEELDVLRS